MKMCRDAGCPSTKRCTEDYNAFNRLQSQHPHAPESITTMVPPASHGHVDSTCPLGDRSRQVCNTQSISVSLVMEQTLGTFFGIHRKVSQWGSFYECNLTCAVKRARSLGMSINAATMICNSILVSYIWRLSWLRIGARCGKGEVQTLNGGNVPCQLGQDWSYLPSSDIDGFNYSGFRFDRPSLEKRCIEGNGLGTWKTLKNGKET